MKTFQTRPLHKFEKTQKLKEMKTVFTFLEGYDEDNNYIKVIVDAQSINGSNRKYKITIEEID